MVTFTCSKERENSMRPQPYDPKWHPEMAKFAQRLAKPENIPQVRAFAEQLYDAWANKEFSHGEFLRRLVAFREYERDPRKRDLEPLTIDEQLVEIAAYLPYARSQTLAWLRPIYDELICIARRTKWERQALLNVRPAPSDDLY